jgi:hypothetical protein
LAFGVYIGEVVRKQGGETGPRTAGQRRDAPLPESPHQLPGSLVPQALGERRGGQRPDQISHDPPKRYRKTLATSHAPEAPRHRIFSSPPTLSPRFPIRLVP